MHNIAARNAFLCSICAAAQLLLIAGTGWAAPAPATSLDPSLPLARYVLASWQRKDGLPQNTVANVAQTPDGYLWLTTQDGLVRFDGVRFTVFQSANTPALRSNDVRALHVDDDGGLWIGTSAGDLARLVNGRLVDVTRAAELRRHPVGAIHRGRLGELWVGTCGGGLVRVVGEHLTRLSKRDGLAGDSVTALAEDESGGLWIGTHTGVSHLAAGRLRSWGPADGLPSADVRAVLVARDGTVWIGTAAGVARFAGGRFERAVPELAGQLVQSLHEDRAGTLWIGSAFGGLYRMARGAVSRLGVAEGLSDADVRAVFEDREGSLWVGTNAGGLNRLQNPRVLTYGAPEGLSHDIALAVAADRAGTLWVATYGGGVNRLRDGRWSALTTADGLVSDVVLSLAPARDGGMWLGTRAGVDRFAGSRFRHYGNAFGLGDEPVLALLEDRQGALWVGTRSGLRRVGPRGASHYTTAEGLGSDVVLALLEARDGALWVGTEGGGVSVIREGRLTTYSTSHGLPGDIVQTLTEDRDGDIWLGTAGSGLVRYRDGRFRAFTSADGLHEDMVLRVLEDGAGDLWLSGNRGISRVRKSDLESFAAGRLPRIPVVWFDEADGMRSAECNGGIQPAGWRTADGRLWFPTLAGVVAVDPAALARTPHHLPVVIEEAVVDQLAVSPSVPVEVPPRAHNLELRYAAPTSLAAGKVRFRYRLDGFDAGWVEAGDRRVAYYTNVPPGQYRFRVEARRGGEAWSAAAASLPVRVGAHLYQRKSFWASALALAVLLSLVYSRRRLDALRERERVLSALAEARREALEELQASRARHRELFENVAEGIYQSTPEGRVLLANPALARLLGYDSPAGILALDARTFYVDTADRTRLAAALAEADEVRNFEVAMRRRDGSEIAVLLNVRVVRDERGAATWHGAVFDITERKRFEEQIRQLQKMETVGRLAGSVAHDFNNLLTPILGYSELMLMELPSGHAAALSAEEIRRAAESAAALTRQLLAFSRRERPQLQVLDPNAVVQRVERLLRRLLGENVALLVQLDPGLGAVRIDANQLEQVLLNLVVNAREAMPKGGTVSLTTECVRGERSGAGTWVAIRVADSGCGIPPAVKARLFEPFFTTKPQGTGLGLATVHDIVRTARGKIVVESEDGCGAVFSVLLPVAETAHGKPDGDDRPLVSTAAEGTVLLVEDDEAVRQLTERVLAAAGLRVLTAESAEDALILEEKHVGRIDLLLTDVVLPGISGAVLAERLRGRRPRLRVLYSTGYPGNELERFGLSESTSVVRKPFQVAELRRRIAEALSVESGGSAA